MSNEIVQVLHVSDLHLTHKSDESINACNALLAEVSRQNKIGLLTPECVILTGDLVYDGSSSDDYDLLQQQFLDPLVKILGIERRDIFISPGNHDIDRGKVPAAELSLASCKNLGNYEEDLDNQLKELLHNFLEFTGSNGYSSISRKNIRFKCFDRGNYHILANNGLVGCYARESNGDRGKLFCTERYLQAVSELDISKLFFATHHPLSWYEDSTTPKLEKLLAEKKSVFFSGHLHDPQNRAISNGNETLTTLAAGAVDSGQSKNNHMSINWINIKSGAVYVRTLAYDPILSRYSPNTALPDIALPEQSKEYFASQGILISNQEITNIVEEASRDAQLGLCAALGQEDESDFVNPDISIIDLVSETSPKISCAEILERGNPIFINGSHLSGKSSLLYHLASLSADTDKTSVPIYLNYRKIPSSTDFLEKELTSKLGRLSPDSISAKVLMRRGLITLFLDDFSASDNRRMKEFSKFVEKYPRIRLICTNFEQREVNHGALPPAFKAKGFIFLKLEPITTAKTRALISRIGIHDSEKANALVKRVFQSISRLRAPRTIFYADSLVRLFVHDAEAEPLNRYLLIENMVTHTLRETFTKIYDPEPIDMDLILSATAFVAKSMYDDELTIFDKDYFFAEIAKFKKKKNISVDTSEILDGLVLSRTLCEGSNGYFFRLQCFESYFLSFQMKYDSKFRRHALSIDNFYQYTDAIEFFAAANPSNEELCDTVFKIMTHLSEKLGERPQVEDILKQFSRGSSTAVEHKILEALSETGEEAIDRQIDLDNPDNYERDVQLRENGRKQIHPGEEVAISFLLAASVLGVARLLDGEDKEGFLLSFQEIMDKIISGLLYMSVHLAEGGVIRYSGVTIEADLDETKIKREDFLFVISKNILMNFFRTFGTCAGSKHLTPTVLKVLESNKINSVFRTALMSQSFESDLSNSVEILGNIPIQIENLFLQEIIIEMFANQARIAPLNTEKSSRALSKISDITSRWNSAKKDEIQRIRTRIENKMKLRQLVSEAKGIGIRDD